MAKRNGLRVTRWKNAHTAAADFRIKHPTDVDAASYRERVFGDCSGSSTVFSTERDDAPQIVRLRVLG